MIPDFSKRSNRPEIMDDLSLPKATLAQVLEDIDRANRLLGGNRTTLTAVRQLVKGHPKESYIVMDIGCGDGSMLREVVLFFRKANIQVRAIGIDINENALDIARKLSAEFPEIRYRNQDVLAPISQELSCDILITTLTLHHFKNPEIVPLVQRFVKLARMGIVINDLQRSVLAYGLFKAFSAIFIRTRVAKNDGAISILRGFRRRELLAFSRQIPDV
ncbi:MAG: methyltransferase domain-containing protein, partial [Bacteroidota bacterium]